MRKPLVVGNWKMHKTLSETRELIKNIREELSDSRTVEVVLAPPFTALAEAARAMSGSSMHLAGQNVYYEREGAFTGEISARMLLDAGCRYVILGHSERRQRFGELDADIQLKLRAALDEGLEVIFCIGETQEERTAETTREVIEQQIQTGLEGLTGKEWEQVVVAYEPVWAIGTGLNATPEQAQEVHAFIRELIAKRSDAEAARRIRILYGGSVTPDNSASLLAQGDIDGVLVGGASLVANKFCAIINSVQ